MSRHNGDQSMRKSKTQYQLVYEICQQCGKEVVLPCKACLIEEADKLLSIHYEDPDEQRRYEEVFAYNRRHGHSMFSSQPGDQRNDDALTLVKDFPDGCWRSP